MSVVRPRRFALHALAVWLALAAAAASGEHRFDVPYVPTPQVVVEEMLRLAQVGAEISSSTWVVATGASP